MRSTSSAFVAFLLLFPALGDSQTCTLPDATITIQGSSSDGYVCGGQSFTAEVPDAGAGATYAWSLNLGHQATISSGQGTRVVTVTVQDPGPYGGSDRTDLLRVGVTSSCGTANGSRQIARINTHDHYSVYITPMPTKTGAGFIGCANATFQARIDDYFVDWGGPERTHQWQLDNGTILSGQGTPQITFQTGSPGTLGWSVMTQDRCTSVASYYPHTGSFLTVAAVESAPTIVAPSSVAPNSTHNTANLSNWQELFTIGPRLSSFLWSISNGAIQGDGNGVPVSFTAGSSGSVTLTATLTDYCSHTYTPSVNIPIVERSVAITADDRVCSDQRAQASVPPLAGATYVWNVTGGAIMSGQGTPLITFVPYAVNVVVSVTTNGTSASKSIAVSPSPDATIATSQSVVAPHAALTASVADAGTEAQYQWTPTNATINGPSSQREVAYTAGDSGNVRLDVVVSTAAGCAASSSMTIPVACPPVAARADLKVIYVGASSGCTEWNGRACAKGETIRFRASSATSVADCEEVRWRFGTRIATGAAVEQRFDADGVYPITLVVGPSTAQTIVVVGSQRRRAAGH